MYTILPILVIILILVVVTSIILLRTEKFIAYNTVDVSRNTEARQYVDYTPITIDQRTYNPEPLQRFYELDVIKALENRQLPIPYLNVYDLQEYYRSHPYIYPVETTPAIQEFADRRV